MPRPSDVQLRHARWLIEQAATEIRSMPNCANAAEAARQLLGQLAGDYREGEEATFAEVETFRLKEQS